MSKNSSLRQAVMQKAVYSIQEHYEYLQHLIKLGYKIHSHHFIPAQNYRKEGHGLLVVTISSKCKSNNISEHIIDE